MKKNILIIIGVIFFVVVCLITSFVIISDNRKENRNDNKENQNVVETNSTSFRYKMLSKDKLDLSEDEKLVLDYFDNSYTKLTSNIAFTSQKYTDLFKNMKLYVDGKVLDIIKSDDEGYKAIVKLYNDNYDIEEDENHYCIIEGEQQLQRFQKDDYITVYGVFETSELMEYNGVKYTMPKIKSEKWIENGAKFSNDEVRKISKYIFGDNIRFDTPKGCAYNRYCENYPLMGYLVKLENPKNPNYTMFNVFRGGGFIEVGYCTDENYDELCSSTQQNIEVAYDYKHFIILTYEKATETAYMEYYDREFNKIWRREIDKEGNIDDSGVRAYYDYNDKYLAVVMDGYLNIISLKDGTDVIDPILIGTDHEVIMFSDYMLLLGYNKKDYIMKINYDGKIEKKVSINDSEIDNVLRNNIQLIDNKVVIMVEGLNKEESLIYKILKLDSDLNIEIQTDDFS